MHLSEREKILLSVLAVLVLGTVVYFSVQGLTGYQRELEAELTRKRTLLTRVETLEESLRRLQRGTTTRQAAPVIARLERMATQHGLQESLQLNPVPSPSDSGVEVVEVKLDNLTLDDAMRFIYAVENAEPVLVVEQLELNPAFRDRELLRLSLRVAGQG